MLKMIGTLKPLGSSDCCSCLPVPSPGTFRRIYVTGVRMNMSISLSMKERRNVGRNEQQEEGRNERRQEGRREERSERDK